MYERRNKWRCWWFVTVVNRVNTSTAGLCGLGSAAGRQPSSQDQQWARIASLFGEVPPSSAAPPAEIGLPQQPANEGNSAHESPEAPGARGLPCGNGVAGSDAAAAAVDVIDGAAVNGAISGNVEELKKPVWRCRCPYSLTDPGQVPDDNPESSQAGCMM